MNIPKQLTTVTTLSKLIAGILFVTLLFVGFLVGMQYQKSIQLETISTTASEVITPPSQKGDIIEFEGVLNNFIKTCEVDGVCIAIVDDYEIIVNPGMINPLPDKLGTSDVWVEDIGKRVKVRAQVIDNKELTIIGAEGLYVLKINTASDNPSVQPNKYVSAPDQVLDEVGICNIIANSTFQSVKQYPVGRSSEMMGSFKLTVANDSFDWMHGDLVEYGTYTCDDNVIVATVSRTLSKRIITASYNEKTEILNWDGIEYKMFKEHYE